MIRDLILDFTRKCNSQCLTCNIWREGGPELDLETIGELLNSPMLAQLKCAYLTGGEPYLSDNMVAIAAILHSAIPDCMIAMATNGLIPERIVAQAAAIRDMGVYLHVDVSLNGDREVHDLTRNMPGGWVKAMKTLHGLKQAGIATGIAYLAHPWTIGDYPYIMKLAWQEGAPVGITWARATPRYGWQKGDVLPGEWDDWQQRMDSIEVLPRYFGCPAMKSIIVVRPDGEVWPCEQYDLPLGLGNLHEQSLSEIVQSDRWARVSRYIVSKQCQPFNILQGPCRMDCYARRSNA